MKGIGQPNTSPDQHEGSPGELAVLPLNLPNKPPGMKTDRSIVKEFALARRPEELSARAIFADFTIISSAALERRIRAHFAQHGYAAVFSDHSKYGRVFLAYGKEGQPLEWKTHLLREESSDERYLERDLEAEVCKVLEARGEQVRRQVPCGLGVADIVTDVAVYEVKVAIASPTQLCHAVGQALMYRQAINPSRRAVVVTRSAITEPFWHEVTEKLGVELWRFPDPPRLSFPERLPWKYACGNSS